jgi:hypothetical protein
MNDDSVGIYFLGDDGAYHWLVPMLHSLRIADPNVTLYCIPFSNRIEKLGRLESKFGFRILDDPTLAELDEIGREVLASMPPPQPLHLVGMFRKMFSFWGPLQKYLYTDADVVFLDGLGTILDLVRNNQDLMFAHKAINEAYIPGDFQDRMVREFHSPGINAGLWAARRGLLTLARIRELSIEAKPIAGNFPANIDQPFLNFCLDKSQVPMTTLDIRARCAWAGDHRRLKTVVGKNKLLNVTWPDGDLVPAIHWAGCKLNARMPNYRIHRYFRALEMTRGEQAVRFTNEMVERTAFTIYRTVRTRLGIIKRSVMGSRQNAG